MNSTKLKAVLLGASCFAFASTFAQDSPSTPKPDTMKMPRHDSTTMNLKVMNNVAIFKFKAADLFFATNEGLVATKNEAESEILTSKPVIKIS